MESIFVTVLNMSITGGLIVAVLALLRLMFKSLPRRYSYMLWAIPALRLLCPISISSVVSFFNLLKPRTVEQNRMEYIVPPAAEYVSPTLPADPVITALPPAYHDSMEDVVKEVPKALSIGEIAGLIWAAVAVGIVIWAVISYIRIGLKVRKADKADGYYICENKAQGLPCKAAYGADTGAALVQSARMARNKAYDSRYGAFLRRARAQRLPRGL